MTRFFGEFTDSKRSFLTISSSHYDGQITQSSRSNSLSHRRRPESSQAVRRPHPPHSTFPLYMYLPSQSPSSQQLEQPQSPPAHLQSLHTRPRRIPIPPHPSNTAPDAAFHA